MKEEDKPVNALFKLGIKPEEISYVIQTHLHLDHAGSTKLFPNAKVIVQLNELRYAYFPDALMKGAYIENDIKDRNIQYTPIVGVRVMFDGKIVIFPTPGHTPGHQSILIRLEKHKPVILTGDAIYLRENFEKNIPSGFALNFADAAYSAETIGNIAKEENADIWFGHDPEFFKTLKLAPEYYE
ncbi:MAG: N-acyl homoserine lactonase family protein [Deferribacterota bacterium]|nr:N-acyl homoserine lactonase family protein [Deferribacterota bacterium]